MAASASPAWFIISEFLFFRIPTAVLFSLVAAAGVIFATWRRGDKLRAQREMLRKTYELGEEVLSAGSADQILQKVRQVVPRIFSVSAAQLYLYNRQMRTLDAVSGDGRDTASIPLNDPPAGPQAGAVACFQYRTLLAIPDTSRSPFPVSGGNGTDNPRSLVFVPMMAQGEVVGILEMDRRDRSRELSREEQTLAQHLGNQIGVAVKLLDQRAVREQLFRTEKLAAVGQLISGVVNDLQGPLATIANVAHTSMADVTEGGAAESMAVISAEARRASEIVTRLVGFAGASQAPPQQVELNGLLNNLIEFREREWKVRGIRVRTILADEPLKVMGSQGQLEQVFLNLLVHAELSLSEANEKLITIRSSAIARRALVEISFTGPKTGLDPFSKGSEETAGATGLALCRSLITGHSGEIRLVEPVAADPTFQIELPRIQRSPAAGSDAGRGHAHVPTALVIEPAEAVQTQLQALLAARSYRVVPVKSSDEGLDLAQRLRFDAVFCSVHAPGLNWVETAEQLKSRVGRFVLMSDSYMPELAADFAGDNCFVLPKPLDDKQLDRVLEISLVRS